jgi:acyl-CoA synthetase (AMP-forming)/AMP-acid ligase II
LYCEERLAYYCVPSLILAVDDIPLTSRGKVDKRLLLARALAHQAENTCTEQQVPA